MVLALLLASLPLQTRLVTEQGPVHVAIPPRATVTVVYVHGYWTNVDDAWLQHRLPEQLGGVGAAVIAPEAPSGPGEPVRFPDLDALLGLVEARTGEALPADVVAIGHSGAYRTLERWAGAARLQRVVLLDGFYGSARAWERLAAEGRLHLVGRHTARRSAPFCARHPNVRCERSPLGHLELVTQGAVIPRVLREALAALTPGT